MSTEKVYARGNASEHVFENGSSLVNFSINLEDLKQYSDEKGWINLVIQAKRETDQFGNTHAVTVNTWKPDKKKAQTEKPRAQQDAFAGPTDAGEDLPF